jgi:uncharacterized protein YyaL (SSP411 family)
MNRLKNQKSPYLLQHKDNPVDWYSWGPEAFEAANQQSKPIFLSIGYSTCYWCHVMEKECFEDGQVAEVLNENFISIKLDREERPDVDQIYMDAVVGITGHGGWPMSVFLTPDLKPFFGGTYYPKSQFIPLLEKIGEVWKTDKQSLLQSSNQLASFLAQTKVVDQTQTVTVKELFKNAKEYFSKSFDRECGGFGGAPKFPQPSHLEFLLKLSRRSKDKEAMQMALITLEAICRGGIYDQLGGGFHRYAVDRNWLVPHFEKMLYDNAQLVSVLVSAFQSSKEAWYLEIAKETLDYCLEILESNTGGFYAAEDAGEVGTEGEFYVWEYRELEHLLTKEELESVKISYGVTEGGNFEGATNILTFGGDFSDRTAIDSVKKRLRKVRDSRERPFKDKKIITSWNGLILTALSKVIGATGDKRYLQSAMKAADFIVDNLLSTTKLQRRFCDGEAAFDGVLEDYSFLIQGLLDLYEVSGETKYFTSAESIQEMQNSLFWDDSNGAYYFAGRGSSDLITRKKDYNDGATPSGNSVSALNLLRLYQLTGLRSYEEYFTKLKAAMLPHVNKYPGAFTTFLSALDFELESQKSVVVSGEKSAEIAKAIKSNYFPNTPVYLADEDGPELLKGKTSADLKIFICSKEGCSLPIDDVGKLFPMLATITI